MVDTGHRAGLWELSLTLGEKEVGHERALEGGLAELQAVWDLPQQEFYHNQKLVHLHRVWVTGAWWSGSSHVGESERGLVSSFPGGGQAKL